MSITLDKIDSAPIASSNFDHQFLQWIWVLVDSLNENIAAIESGFSIFQATGYTQTEITDMQTAGQLEDGVFLYDTTNAEYVGRQSGTLTKFTTTTYP
jgi:hypothetical protein